MPIDSEPIASSCKPDDFASMIMDGLSSIEYKMMFFLMLIFLFISSDVFTGRILTRFKGAVDGKYSTSYGVFLQGLFLVLFYTIVDVLNRQKII